MRIDELNRSNREIKYFPLLKILPRKNLLLYFWTNPITKKIDGLPTLPS
jgi:hypothetical protein